MIDKAFWKERKVFLTGHTGFKGSWLALWLKHMGADVFGYALAPEQNRSIYHATQLENSIGQVFADIRELSQLRAAVNRFNPQIVIHMAAQPLVKFSYSYPVETFATNIMGTVNILEALKENDALEAVVVVTSDKCYENQELNEGYREDHPLGGHDPYSSSKACAELVTASWYRSFVQGCGTGGADFFGIATARAGNVIGGGDWAKDRLVPDVLRAIEGGKPVDIRNPHSVRPWQYVLEPLAGYLTLAQSLAKDPGGFSEAWNFGPTRGDTRTVGWLVERLLIGLGEQSRWHYDENPTAHETNYLQLNCSKSEARLNWRPLYSLEMSIEKIVSWYNTLNSGADMRSFMINEIDGYMGIVNGAGNG